MKKIKEENKMKNKLFVCFAVSLLIFSNALYAEKNELTSSELCDDIVRYFDTETYHAESIPDYISELLLDKNGNLKEEYKTVFEKHGSYIYYELLTNTSLNSGKHKLFKYLVKLDPYKTKNLSDVTQFGNTLLHIASRKGEKEIIELLISEKVKINVVNSFGRTPLHLYMNMKAKKEIVKLLISKGAKINATDMSGNTPLHFASVRTNKEIVELLISKGAEINATDMSGCTPLHCASFFGNTETAELLIWKGASLESLDSKNQTPLDDALNGCHEDMVKLLLYYGADPNVNTNKRILSDQIASLNKNLTLNNNMSTITRKSLLEKVGGYYSIGHIMEKVSSPEKQLLEMKNYRRKLMESENTKAVEVIDSKIREMRLKIEEKNIKKYLK